VNTQQSRIAIIDDDPFVSSHLEHNFRQRIPDAEVIGISNPIAPAGFDVYIVDREFGGDSHGRDLVKRIKKIAPKSLVVAYSAFLDRDFLRSLVSEDCEGAFDKGSIEELEKMTALIEDFLETGELPNSVQKSSKGTVRLILDLLREWNIRLSKNGQAIAKYHTDVR
jgi:DNA-binding NarL/FixJ family response regulator